MSDKFISIVMSQYNEEENLKRGVLQQMADYLKNQDFKWEVIVIDDESTDNSYNVTKEFVDQHPNFKLIKIKHGGKAAGHYRGIQETQGDLILTTDIDQSAPLKEMEKLLPYFDQGYNVVIGSRGTKRKKFSLLRKTASTVFRITRKIIALPHINDTQCGFKMFRAEPLKRLFPKLDAVRPNPNRTGWNVTAFDVELLFMLEKDGNRIKEVPVEWIDEDISTTKNRKFIKESIDMGKQILNVRINWLKGKYRKSNLK